MSTSKWERINDNGYFHKGFAILKVGERWGLRRTPKHDGELNSFIGFFPNLEAAMIAAENFIGDK